MITPSPATGGFGFLGRASHRDRCPHRHAIIRAFSLVELTIAIGIFSFVLIAILGLLPVGMKLLRESEESMASNLIFQDVAARLQAYSSRPSQFRDTTARNLIYLYDSSGLFLGESATGDLPAAPEDLPHLTPAYLARVTIGALPTYPPDVSNNQMLGVEVKIVSALRPGADGQGETLDEAGFFLPMMADNAWPWPQ